VLFLPTSIPANKWCVPSNLRKYKPILLLVRCVLTLSLKPSATVPENMILAGGKTLHRLYILIYNTYNYVTEDFYDSEIRYKANSLKWLHEDNQLHEWECLEKLTVTLVVISPTFMEPKYAIKCSQEISMWAILSHMNPIHIVFYLFQNNFIIKLTSTTISPKYPVLF
jgi:hypothetical protein